MSATQALSRDSIRQLVHSFYDDVRADDRLAPVFNGPIGERWAVHLDRMVEFWSTVMLGTHSFKGNVFGKHMAVQGVEPEHFSRWMALWHRHTDHLFEPAVAAEFQRAAHGIGRNLYYGYFGQAVAFAVEGAE